MPASRQHYYDLERTCPKPPPTGDEIRMATLAIRTTWDADTEDNRRVGHRAGRAFIPFGEPPYDPIRDEPKDPLPFGLT